MSSMPHSHARHHDKPLKADQQAESKASEFCQAYQRTSQDSDSNQVRDDQRTGSFKTSQQRIGWLTPIIIIGCFLAATAISITHLVYFRFLNSKSVDSTISQSWNNALSVVFAHAFATTLTTSASTAFTQLLWRYLRRRPLSVSNIDALFSLNSRSSNLYQLRILKTTPLLWFFGLLIPLISIATIFPPGSIRVLQLAIPSNTVRKVYTLDVDNRGNGSSSDFFSFAMFEVGPDGEYNRPDNTYLDIAKYTIREETYTSGYSVCGANCTYNLTISAPSLRCEDDTPNTGLEKLVLGLYGNESRDSGKYSNWDPSLAQFMAAPYVFKNQFKFDITYRSIDDYSLRNISCTIMEATYLAHIRYLDSIQTVTVTVEEGQPLNASLLDQPKLFYDVKYSIPSPSSFTYSDSLYHNFTMRELFEVYHGTQLRAMSDTLSRSLAGAVSGLGTDNYFTTHTIIEETFRASKSYDSTSSQYTGVSFNLSASIIEDLMKNITISFLNYEQDEISAPTTTVTYQPAYVFENQLRLVASYAGALALSFAFILLGFIALLQNGTPASSGGFIQIMCTTAHGDGIMNRLARESSLTGGNSASTDLSNLKIRFGVVADSASERKCMAFGTVEETEVLLKSS